MVQQAERPAAFGVFKPVGYTILSFPPSAPVDDAAEALEAGGSPPADLIRYSPEAMQRQAETDIAHASPLAGVGQELNLVKAHLALARQGHSFLAVRTPDDATVERIKRVAERFGAARAQRYGTLVIEELIEVGTTDRQSADTPDRGLDAQTLSGREGSTRAR
jgi:hypothetical protein